MLGVVCWWDASMPGRRRFGDSVTEYGPRLVLKQHKAAVKALDWCPFIVACWRVVAVRRIALSSFGTQVRGIS